MKPACLFVAAALASGAAARVGAPVAMPGASSATSAEAMPDAPRTFASALTGRPGDPARGRALVADRQRSLCLLCHRAPLGDPASQGDLGPDLAGVGGRLSAAELRARLVDPARFNPATVMPAYLRRDGLWRVAASWRGRSLLSAGEVEDVVAFLASLR